MSQAAFVASQRTEYRVPHAVVCRALDVSESWFYKWRDRQPTPAQQRRAELDAKVREIFDDSGGNPGTYGSPRVHAELRDQGWRVTEKTVAASMSRQHLVARPKKLFRCLTRPDKRAVPFPDLVRRDFSAPAPDVKWCGDMTEIPTLEGKLYLADVEDLFSRRVVGFAMSEHPDAELAKAALQTAVAVQGGSVAGVIFHTDRVRPTPPTCSPKRVSCTRSASPWGAPDRASTTRRPSRSSRPSSTSCCPESRSEPRRKPVDESLSGSTPTTAPAGTACAR